MTDYLKPKIPWEQLLYNWMDEKAKSDFSWLRRNNRVKDVYLPSLYSEDLGKIILLLDYSGSISDRLINRFMSEINNLRRKHKFETVVISHDTRVADVKSFGKEQEIKFETNAGGGTAFKPAYDYINANIRDAVGIVHFTDMYTGDLRQIKPPKADVVFMNYGDKDAKAPFGKIIYMEE